MINDDCLLILAMARLDQWIWWAGPALGALLFSIVFQIAPPYHSVPVPSHNG